MTVKVFVSRDSEGRPWPPDYSHEVNACQAIVSDIYYRLNHHNQLYVIVANLHQPSADLVVITERGLGVAELKGHGGRITVHKNGYWYADRQLIKAGGQSDTPHEQVQTYARKLRQALWSFIAPETLRYKSWQTGDLKFQTAVCFTNPSAELSQIRTVFQDPSRIERAPWESKASILTIDEVPSWVDQLRFELQLGPEYNFEPYRLSPERIQKIVVGPLDGTEWAEILDLLQVSREPYGFLHRLDDDAPIQTHNLVRDAYLIGRDHAKCDVVIPDSCVRVSREHAVIKRIIGRHRIEVIFEDQSNNGSYINGVRVTGPQELQHMDKIILGGRNASVNTALLEYRDRFAAMAQPEVTAIGSRSTL